MSFDTLAPYYRIMERVTAGGILQRCRTAFLAETTSCRRALLLGEGPGRFLEELLRANSQVEVTCVERSPRMIAEARRRLNASDLARVHFVQADALTWQPLSMNCVAADVSPLHLISGGSQNRLTSAATVQGFNARFQRELTTASLSPCDREREGGTSDSQERARPRRGGFDLIVTHFFLDCFRREELAALVSKIAASATADARWLLADFREAERGWRRWRGRAALALMYGFFRVATGLSASQLTPPDEFLEAGGFRLAARRLANFEFAHSDLWRRTAA
jgi:SAM-dependent methyltransferase